jgi:hypothetical protein
VEFTVTPDPAQVGRQLATRYEVFFTFSFIMGLFGTGALSFLFLIGEKCQKFCLYQPVLRIRIRIHRIHVFFGLLDPDPDPTLDLDPDPDPSIIVQK